MLDYGFNFMNTKIYIDNESTICIVKNPVFYSKTKHIEIRHHFIRDSHEKKLIQHWNAQPIVALIEGRMIAMDWRCFLDEIKVNTGISKISTARIGKAVWLDLVEIREARSLRVFWKKLSYTGILEFCDKHNMVAYLKKPFGSEGFQEIVDFLNGRLSAQSLSQALNKDIELPQTSVPITNVLDEAVHQERGDSIERAATTATSLEAVQDSSNIAKTQSMTTPTEPISQETGSDGGPMRQETIEGVSAQTRFDRASKLSYDSPLRGGNTPGSDEDIMTLLEDLSLNFRLGEDDRRNRSSDGDTLVTRQMVVVEVTRKISLEFLSASKVLADAARVHTYSRRRRAVSTGSGGVSTTSRIVSTTGMIQQVNMIILSSSATKDKAAIRLQEHLDEEEIQRIARDAKVAQRLQEEFDAAEKQKMAQVHQAAQGFTEDEWEDIRARVKANKELTQKLQAEGRDKDDLVKLWSLVHERFNSTEPTEDKERELWVELKRLFEPDDDDILWKLQRYMHDPLKWRLYDTCVVHHVSTERGHDIFMLVEKDYPLTRALMTLMLSNKLQVDEYSVMADELLRKIFILANRPRQ
ncbi:hypothetical protein Tco_0587743 [Tanacetum coccineum]